VPVLDLYMSILVHPLLVQAVACLLLCVTRVESVPCASLSISILQTTAGAGAGSVYILYSTASRELSRES
jgi:hypothetical protein